MEPAQTTPAPNWLEIELLYRAGVLTLREIGAHHGVSHTAVNKRAKRDGWSRDLADRIRHRAAEKVAESDARAKERFPKSVSKEMRYLAVASIESHAEVISQVRLRHHKGIREAGEHLDRLFEELKILSTKRNTSLPEELYEQIAMLKDLSSVLATVINVERKAYRLDQATEPGANRRTSLPIRFVSAAPYDEEAEQCR
jgi:hypothetical protein